MCRSPTARPRCRRSPTSSSRPTCRPARSTSTRSPRQINVFLTIVYVLLVLAIIIALFGIANTLSLSVYERIRELGLAPRGRADAQPAAVDGALGVGDHRGVRHDRRDPRSGCSSAGASSRSSRALAGLPGAVHDPVRSAHRRADRRRGRRCARRLATGTRARRSNLQDIPRATHAGRAAPRGHPVPGRHVAPQGASRPDLPYPLGAVSLPS